MTLSNQRDNAADSRLSFMDTALVDCATSHMMAEDWDYVVVPSLFVLKAIRKQWLRKKGPSILPKMVTYVHPMTYTNPCALGQKPVSLAQGMAWCLHFFQNYFSENAASPPLDLAGFARSLLHLWEHIDRMALYDHPDPEAAALWENHGVLLPESLLQSGHLSGTPHLVQEWLKWWPQWLHRQNLCSQTRATYWAQHHAATFWTTHCHHKILLCVQNIEKLPTDWLKRLMSLPNVRTLLPKDSVLSQRLGIQDGGMGGANHPVRGMVSQIVCAHESESARVMAILIQDALQTEADIGLVVPCSTMLKRVSCALKIDKIHLPTPYQSLVNTLLQSIWRGSLQGWPLSEVVILLRHPLILKAYPIVGAMTRFIEQYRPKWSGIGGNNSDVQTDGMPRWLKGLHRKLQDAFGSLTADCQADSVKQPMAFWIDGHVKALDYILPVAVWDHDDVVEKVLQESSNDLPYLDAVTYGQWFKAWTASLVHMDQGDHWGCERQEREAEDRIVVGSAEDLSALHLGRCIVAVAEPLPKFPWMPKSWQVHFHLGQDQEKECFENSSAEVVLVSVHSSPSESAYRYRAEQHWKKAILQNVFLPIDGAIRPYPPLHRVSISDIQRWHTDPEAFYQQRVLRIKESVISEQQAWGLAMHVLLDHFLRDFPPTEMFSVKELFEGLCALADAFLPEMPWWKWSARRKLLRSIAECEHGHRQIGIRKSLTEQSGHLTFSFPQGSITLFGRADRIDYLDDGTAYIIDYKTGVTPSFVSLDRIESVQLPLEGWMVQSGAMGAPMVVSKLSWWSLHLTHGCRIKTYPRCVSALLDRYAIVMPQWMNQLISGGYGDFPVKIQG